jgi:hypothetical protein
MPRSIRSVRQNGAPVSELRLRTMSLPRGSDSPNCFAALVKLFCSGTATNAPVAARLAPRTASSFF